MLTFKNHGQTLVETNFWDSAMAAEGYFYITISSGVLRLLIPDLQLEHLADMESGMDVIISVGPWPQAKRDLAFEILFDDGSDAPFALHLVTEQCDQALGECDESSEIPFVVIARDGVCFRRSARLRVVSHLPCLEPWAIH